MWQVYQQKKNTRTGDKIPMRGLLAMVPSGDKKFYSKNINYYRAEMNQFDARRSAMIWNYIIHIKVYKNLLFYMMNFYIITKEEKV